MSERMTLLDTGIKVAILKSTSAAVSFLGIALFTRYADASNMGLFFLFQSVLGISALVTNFGISDSIEKRISEGDRQREMLSSGLALKGVILVLVLFAMFLFSGHLNAYLGRKLALIVMIGLFARESSSIAIRVLSGEQKVATAHLLDLSRQIVWLIGGLVLIRELGGGLALIVSLILGYAVAAVGGLFWISTSLGTVSKDAAFSLLDYGKYKLITIASSVMFNWTDVFLIGAFLPNSKVSIFVIAWKVSQLPLTINKAIGATLFPKISQMSFNNRDERVKSLYESTIIPSLYFMLPAVVGGIVLRKELLGYLFSSEYVAGAPVLILLMVGALFQSVYIVSSRFIQGVNRPDISAKFTLGALVINIGLNLFLIQLFGLVGAATATSLSFAFIAWTHHRSMIELYDFSIPSKHILWLVVCSLIMGGTTELVRQHFPVHNLIELLLLITLGVVTYTMVSMIYGPTRRNVEQLVQAVNPF